MAATLYWAEGAKKDFGLSNTDPALIKVFLYILRSVFGVEEERIVVSLRLYEDLNKRECLAFWSNLTGLKLDNTTSVTVLKGSKNGKLKYGMCRIRVRKGGNLLKEFFSIIKQAEFLITPSYIYHPLVAQRIEHRSPKAVMEVQFLPRGQSTTTPYTK